MKRRSLGVLPLLLAMCVATLWAKVNLETKAIKKMIVFIYAADASGEVNKDRAIGTGFLILVPRKPAGGSLLLVTVRHIVDPAWAYCSNPGPSLIYLRVNKKNYDRSGEGDIGVDYVRVELRDERGNAKYWIRDDDPKVDGAVIDLTGSEMGEGGKFTQMNDDWAPLRFSDIAAPDEIESMDVGDSIVSAGLLPASLPGGGSYPLSGKRRNYPFFKFGQISNIPDESIWIPCDARMPALREENAWFINANLVAGNSGSPIFFAPSGHYGGNISLSGDDPRPPALIGVQSFTLEGADISGMTPIEEVVKIIEKNVPRDSDLRRGDSHQPPK